MAEIMTYEEITQHYNGEWVLIAYTDTQDDLEVIKGKVLVHSPDKEDIYKYLESATEEALTIEYIGQTPDDLAFII